MSAHTDENFSTPILKQFASDCDSPALSELSERDRVWDKHRANSQVVAGHYKAAGMETHSERVSLCSLLLDSS